MKYSINGKIAYGEHKGGDVTIFINKIAELFNPESDFDSFIAGLCAVEFHEIGHSECRCGYYYQKLTEFIFYYLRYGKWQHRYTKVLKKIKENRIKSKERAIANNKNICCYCDHDDSCDIDLLFEIEFHELVRDCDNFVLADKYSSEGGSIWDHKKKTSDILTI
jgi:hypothetical protein